MEWQDKMIEWLTVNAGTVTVAFILAAVIFLVIKKMIKDRKSGKGMCNCGCMGQECDDCMKGKK